MLSDQTIDDIEEIQEILSRIKAGNLFDMYAPEYGAENIKMDAHSMLDAVFAEYMSQS